MDIEEDEFIENDLEMVDEVELRGKRQKGKKISLQNPKSDQLKEEGATNED